MPALPCFNVQAIFAPANPLLCIVFFSLFVNDITWLLNSVRSL